MPYGNRTILTNNAASNHILHMWTSIDRWTACCMLLIAQWVLKNYHKIVIIMCVLSTQYSVNSVLWHVEKNERVSIIAHRWHLTREVRLFISILLERSPELLLFSSAWCGYFFFPATLKLWIFNNEFSGSITRCENDWISFLKFFHDRHGDTHGTVLSLRERKNDENK